MKTTKEKIATIFVDYWIGEGMYDKLKGEAKAEADKVAQEALDVVLGELESGEMSDGYHTFNELYEHRHALFASLWNQQGGWKSKKHADSSMFDGWFVAGIDLPSGQITYHLPMRLWDLFKSNELPFAPEWDGHTSGDVVERLKAAAYRLRG